MCRMTHDVDIMHVFNNRTWLDVWNDFDFFDIDYMLYISFYSIIVPIKHNR